jgi:hypothetical protein
MPLLLFPLLMLSQVPTYNNGLQASAINNVYWIVDDVVCLCIDGAQDSINVLFQGRHYVYTVINILWVVLLGLCITSNHFYNQPLQTSQINSCT